LAPRPLRFRRAPVHAPGARDEHQPFVGIAAKGQPTSPRTAAAPLPPNPLLPAEIALEAGR